MSRLFCPVHAALGEEVEGAYVTTYDQEEFDGFGTVEMVVFECTQDPSHRWEHPHPNFWLRWAAYGVDWKAHREQLRRRT